MERATYRIPTHPGDVVKEELEMRGGYPKKILPHVRAYHIQCSMRY